MGLFEQIYSDYKEAIRCKAEIRLSVLRMLHVAVKNEEKNKGRILEDSEILSVISDQVKQRSNSIEQFEERGRKDLADQGKIELNILLSYLARLADTVKITKGYEALVREPDATHFGTYHDPNGSTIDIYTLIERELDESIDPREDNFEILFEQVRRILNKYVHKEYLRNGIDISGKDVMVMAEDEFESFIDLEKLSNVYEKHIQLVNKNMLGDVVAAINKLQKSVEHINQNIHSKYIVRPVNNRVIPNSVKREVWRRDQGKCVYCGSQVKLEFDHIIPVSKGGSNTVRNIQLLCECCNRSKSAKIDG